MLDQIIGIQPETVARTDFRSLDSMLDSMSAVYLCDGVDNLKTIEWGSVEVLFSHSVLEHIKLAELGEFLVQLFRISKVGSIASHNINYMDHLGGGQNHLRFSKDLWESEFLSTSGFYTNRIPAGLMHQSLNGMPTNQYKNSLGCRLAVRCNYRSIKFIVIWGKHINILDRSQLQASLLDAINKQRPLALLPFVLSDGVKAWRQANDSKKTKHQKTR